MDYKEKYNQALERARKSYNKAIEEGWTCDKCIYEEIFPELKKSEDERIRKEIICYIKSKQLIPADAKKEWISWLEKQGEQNNLLNFDEAEKEKNDFVSGQFVECRKSFNEFKEFESYWFEYVGDDTYIGRSDNILNQRFHITPQQLFTLFTHEHCPKDNENQCEQKSVDADEPKFKVEDWITNGEYIWKITNIKPLDYILQSQNGDMVDDNISYVDENFRLWTIQDAKDGDVLCCDNWNNKTIYLFKEQRGSTDIANAYFQIFNRNNETRLMFNKAADFNLNTKPATKEQSDLLLQKMKEAGYEWDAEKKELKKIEQNPAWSEEDEEMLKSIIYCIDGTALLDSDQINWLKSIKDKVQPQSTQEWSEEDEKMKDAIKYTIINSLKPQPHWKPSKQNIKDLEWCADLVKDKMGIAFHRLQVFIDELKKL